MSLVLLLDKVRCLPPAVPSDVDSAPEYHNKVITKVFRGNPYYGCYALAVVIFAIGIIRDSLYERPPFRT